MPAHQLTAHREAQFWALVRHLDLDPTAPIGVLVPVVIERARALPPPHDVGLGAASELAYYLSCSSVILRGEREALQELG